jgi:opacity protein-like surface antigen
MRVVAAALLGLLCASPAAAATLTYKVDGKGPDNVTYTGSLTLTELNAGPKTSGEAYRVVWKIGGQTIEGIGVVDANNDDVMAVSYTMSGIPGVVVMTQKDGIAKGVWYVQGAPGTGIETWTPAAAK